MTNFAIDVYEVVRNIPRGKTMTYSEVAQSAGYPGAARAVGTALSKNFDPEVPCHRVVRSDGRPGRYNRGDAHKIELLRQEGAIVVSAW